MNFELDETETLLSDLVTRFTRERAAAQPSQGYDADGWAQALELGLPAAVLPEAVGGMGLGAVGAMIVAEALASQNVALPWITTAVAPLILLSEIDTPETADLAQDLGAAGDVALMATPVLDGAWSANMVSGGRNAPGISALPERGGWRLKGRSAPIADADGAVRLLVPAIDAGKVELFLLSREAEGLTTQEPPLSDGRRALEISLDLFVPAGSAAHVFAPPEKVAHALRRAASATLSAAAAAQCGAMQSLLDLTLTHTRERHQFGRPLAAFQVLQHRMVDMSVALDEARALTMGAAMAGRAILPDAGRLAIAAWVRALWSAERVGEDAIQCHGGIGMSEEYPAGRFLRRIMVNGGLFGPASSWLTPGGLDFGRG